MADEPFWRVHAVTSRARAVGAAPVDGRSSGMSARRRRQGRPSPPGLATAVHGLASHPGVGPWLRYPQLHPVGLATDVPALVLVVIALLVVYAFTTPHTVLLEDDGLFLMSSATLGVSHPPGLSRAHAARLAGGPGAGRARLRFACTCCSGALGALACGVPRLARAATDRTPARGIHGSARVRRDASTSGRRRSLPRSTRSMRSSDVRHPRVVRRGGRVRRRAAS